MTNELNIPIYRAKNINGLENHIGLLKWNKNKTKFWINDFESGSQEIDSSTLAIHFPDMLDSDNTKIFASLSEDGRGGDNIEAYMKDRERFKDTKTLTYKDINWYTSYQEYSEFFEYDVIKVTGIQQ